MEEYREWTAKWIWPVKEAHGGSGQQRSLFRKTFEVSHPASCELRVDVSADSKYRLYLNGVLVGRGPCKGDMWQRYYDTYDLSSALVAGRNTLAAEVVHYPFALSGGNREAGPVSEWRSDSGGFWLEGACKDTASGNRIVLDTDSTWKSRVIDAVRIIDEKYTLFVGGTEDVEGTRLPHGWRSAAFDDSEWGHCERPIEPLDRLYGGLAPWQLYPRPIPQLAERQRAFARVIRSSMDGGIGSPFPFVVAPGESRWIELDAGEMTTGYPLLEVVGGDGASIRMLYSESYEFEHPEAHGGRRRDVRDDPADKVLVGNVDIYRPAGVGSGVEPEAYEPMGRRAFRFVRVEVRAGSDKLVTILNITYRETGYPLGAVSSVRTSDLTSDRMWAIGLNTLRRCMQDTYEDTPYYEQLQYVMDAKSQALFTYYVSGDDRLARKTIHDFHSSLLPNGLIQSRYPSAAPQIIPGFALYWIMMVYDHYKHFGDAALVRRYLSTADAILGWFDRLIDDSGMIGRMPEPYWSFVDWTLEWRDQAGSPPAKWHGPMTVYNLMAAEALRQAALLNEAVGRRDTAAEYRQRAESIREAVRGACFDEERGLFADGPGVRQFSQHAQIWAVLSGAAEGIEATALMRRMLAQPELPRASFSMSHYLFRALAVSGLYAHTYELWQPWREQIGLGLTAWVEDPVQQRSDCHGWGALHLYEYPAETLGVQPEEPGYRVIRIAPQPSGLTWASGSVTTPRGEVRVAWRIDEAAADGMSFCLEAEVPAGVPIVVVLPDGTRHEPADAKISLACPLAAQELVDL